MFKNAMRLLYACTLSLNSIRCMERLLNDETLLSFMLEMALKPASKGIFESMFVDTTLRKATIAETTYLLVLWTDLTMVY